MRRRLSTPKASPLLLKRGSADKPPKKQKETASSTPVKAEKTSWFKSLDRRAKSNPKEQVGATVDRLFLGHLLMDNSSTIAERFGQWTQ